jgi:hypothetical protein
MSNKPHPHWMFRARLAHSQLTDSDDKEED